jgi:cation transport ATPase
VSRTINFNLTAAMILNFAAIALAIPGILNPVLGALVHTVGSVAVIINSSLILKWSARKRGGKGSGESAPVDTS